VVDRARRGGQQDREDDQRQDPGAESGTRDHVMRRLLRRYCRTSGGRIILAVCTGCVVPSSSALLIS
jgi:hypothetical protein